MGADKRSISGMERNFPRDVTHDSWLGTGVIEDAAGKLDSAEADGWDKATGYPADRHR